MAKHKRRVVDQTKSWDIVRERKGREPDLGGVRKKRPADRGGIYLPDKLMLVRRIAMQGYTDGEMAKLYGLSESTFSVWRELYPDFDQALREGRTHADADVLVSLYQRATGYDYSEEVAVGGRYPQVMRVKKHAIPEVDAQKYWLNNRCRSEFSSTTRSELTGAGGGPIGVRNETRDELIDAICKLVSPTPDGPTGPGGEKKSGK